MIDYFMLSTELKAKLIELADKYEKTSFAEDDPSRILSRYKKTADIECAAFISAMLAFGRRDQFLKKIDIIFSQCDACGGPASWLKTGKFKDTFASSVDNPNVIKFYRFYSYSDMISLFEVMQNILLQAKTLGEYFRDLYKCRTPDKLDVMCDATNCCRTLEKLNGMCDTSNSCRELDKLDGMPNLPQLICDSFRNCKIVPHGKNCANKRVNMFLRWMVRQNSPVDVGLWTWYNPADLIIPLDTHVLNVAKQLGLIEAKSIGNAKTAQAITDSLKDVWPTDPCKGDYALFGLGIDDSN